jgi:pantoate--beta-alanine ligase
MLLLRRTFSHLKFPASRYFPSIGVDSEASLTKVPAVNMAPNTTPSSTLPVATPPLAIYTTVASLRSFRRPLFNVKSLGFVPTMGALHEGHLSLIRSAATENDSVAVSIFVNPAQFSPTEDLAVYPRTLASDLAALESLNAEFQQSGVRGRVEALFLPSVGEMYPSGIPQVESQQRGAFVTVQPLASKLEGVSRPHFFRGVATVVAKLFNIVQPDAAYFGQKDVQQSIVLKRMLKDLHFPIELKVCPTGREQDGLAMSSRNVYLGGKRRGIAPVLYRALKASEEEFARLKKEGGAVDAKKIRDKGFEVLEAGGNGVSFELEYFSLADMEELEELKVVDVTKGAVLSAAIRMLPTQPGEGVVRLIDNIILEGDE